MSSSKSKDTKTYRSAAWFGKADKDGGRDHRHHHDGNPHLHGHGDRRRGEPGDHPDRDLFGQRQPRHRGHRRLGHRGPRRHRPLHREADQADEPARHVDYTTENGTAVAGTDYAATSGTLTFNVGGSQSPGRDSPGAEQLDLLPPRAFDLRITSGTNVLLSSPVDEGRIRDDELPAVRVVGGSATEGAGNTIPFTVSLEGPPSTSMTVNYATADQTGANHATASTDYQPTSGSFTFVPGGVMSQSVTVTVNDDSTFEADAEAFDLTATVPANGQSTAGPGVIIDNEAHPPVISIGGGTVVEGDTGHADARLPRDPRPRRRVPGDRPVLDRRTARRPPRATTRRRSTSSSSSRRARPAS